MSVKSILPMNNIIQPNYGEAYIDVVWECYVITEPRRKV